MGLVSVLLMLLIKIFFIVFVIGLVGGFIVAAKNYIFTPEDVAVIKDTFTFNKAREEK